MTSRYIAIDWGSTNLRAWLYQDDQCLESRQSAAGVTRLNGESPAAVFSEITRGWRDGATPAVLAGMVGSNVGWKVAPYLPVPVDFSAIGQQLTSVGDKVWIIPGLSVSRDANQNVMRGEETQLLGARMIAAVAETLALGHDVTVLVGSDIPDLPRAALTDAHAALAGYPRDSRVVFGPAADGGFYLVAATGVSSLARAFHGVTWSQPSVLTDVTARLVAARRDVATVRGWPDLDDAADLTALLSRPDGAPRTRAAASRIPPYNVRA